MKKCLILFLSLFIICSCNEQKEERKENTVQATSINCNTMKEKIVDGAYLIDVRTKEEYKNGTIEFAINVPLDEISNIINTVTSKDTPVIVFCHSGTRSKQAAQKLLDLGYLEVYDLGSINSCN